MKQIFKFPLDLSRSYIEVPKDSQFLSVIMQGHQIVSYFLVDPSAALEKKRFTVIGTGWSLDNEFLDKHEFVGTLNDSPYIWHVYFEKAKIEIPKNGDCPVCGGVRKTTDPNTLPYFEECHTCGMKVECRDEVVTIVNLNGHSFVFDNDAGFETNQATFDAYIEMGQHVRENLE